MPLIINDLLEKINFTTLGAVGRSSLESTPRVVSEIQSIVDTHFVPHMEWGSTIPKIQNVSQGLEWIGKLFSKKINWNSINIEDVEAIDTKLKGINKLLQGGRLLITEDERRIIQALAQEVKKRENDIKEYRDKTIKLQDQLARLREERLAISGYVSGDAFDLLELQNKLIDKDDQLFSYKLTIDNLQKECDNLKQQLKDLEGQWSSKMGLLQRQLAESTAPKELNSAEKAVRELIGYSSFEWKNSLSSLKDKYDGINSANLQYASFWDNCYRQIGFLIQLLEQINELNVDLKEKGERVEKQQLAEMELREEIRKFRIEVTNQNNKIESLQRDLKGKDRAIDGLNLDLDSVNSALVSAQEELGAAVRRREKATTDQESHWQKQYNQAQSTVNRLRADYNVERGQREKLQAENVDNNNNIRQLKDLLDRKESIIRDKIGRERQRFGEGVNEIKRLDVDVRGLQSELDTLRSSFEKFKDDIKANSSYIYSLKSVKFSSNSQVSGVLGSGGGCKFSTEWDRGESDGSGGWKNGTYESFSTDTSGFGVFSLVELMPSIKIHHNAQAFIDKMYVYSYKKDDENFAWDIGESLGNNGVLEVARENDIDFSVVKSVIRSILGSED